MAEATLHAGGRAGYSGTEASETSQPWDQRETIDWMCYEFWPGPPERSERRKFKVSPHVMQTLDMADIENMIRVNLKPLPHEEIHKYETRDPWQYVFEIREPSDA